MRKSLNLYKSCLCLSVACAAMMVGCNHRTEPQPSNQPEQPVADKPGQPAANQPGQPSNQPGQPAAAPVADIQDKCHHDGKIITCEKGVCDPATGDCVECLSSSDCKVPEKPVCSDKSCIACDAAHACSNGKCDVNTGKCLECLADSDCLLRSRGICWQGICSACNAQNCTQTCNEITGKCGEPVVLPCPGGNCGDPSPIVIGTIDPGTIAIGNNVRVLVINVPNRTANEKPTEIGSYKVDARVNGMYATVSTEFTVYNPNGRVFEGELEFPLPDDAVVSGYAIDVNGVMVDCAVVEKEKARIAFENEVKKGVDPGLVEQVKGNSYRTRIYPIPANGTRQIRVVYTTPLTIAPNGDAALALPMPKTKLKQRDISISVASSMPAPAVGGLGDKRFESAEAVWRVESHDTNITPKENVLVAMPNLPDVVTGVEVANGDIFFSASVKTADVAQPAVPAMPTKWRIVWDASGSRSATDVVAARKLIDSLPESASYELHVFRNALEPAETFNSRADLITKLDSLAYDGGTDFAPLEAIAAQKFDGPTLFFTDGMDTMNGALPEFGANSMALLSGAARDVSAMRRICGGRTLNLDIVNGEEAIKQILVSPPVVSAVNGADLANIEGIGLAAAGRVTVVGRMNNIVSQATVVLSDGRQIPVTFNTTAVPSGRTIASAWAARRVDELSPRANDNREELLAIGRRFSIVSPVSSMIVFERLDQWLQYDIEPPESLTEMHARWLEMRPSESARQAEKMRREQSWISQLTYEWNARVSWWNDPIPSDRFGGKGGGFGGRRRAAMPTLALDEDDDIQALRAEYDEEEVAEEEEPEDDEYEPTPFAANSDTSMRREEAAGAAKSGGLLAQRNPMNSMLAAGAEDDISAEDDVGNSNGHASRNVGASITVKAWDPQTPYLTAIKDAYAVYKTPESLYAEYLRQRVNYAQSPAFFLDCAGLFFRENQPKLAVRILSNLSELKIDDVGMLRIYAWRLREAGDYDTAILILRKVAKLRADEAISWRDLALTLTMRGKQNHSAADIQEALELFHKTAFTAWQRGDAMWTALIALEELNELVAWTKREQWGNEPPRIPEFDNKFAQNLDTDLRIMMTWDADNTDIDMHVIEPSGEEVYYAHNRSRTGSLVSHDVTTGYGPEEFLHKTAPKGRYLVSTKYFASHQQSLVGPATITVTFYSNWGRPTQKSETVSLRLDTVRGKVFVGEYTVE